MELRQTLLIIQYLSIAGVFIESWLAFRDLKSRLQGCLFFSCVAILVNNIGYLMELYANTKGEYLTALKLSYAGRVWITFSLFLFTVELCHVKVPAFIQRLLAVVHIMIYASVLGIPDNDLYYTSLNFEPGEVFAKVSHGNGIFHHIFMLATFVYVVIAIWWLVRRASVVENRLEKKRLITVIMAYMTEIGLFVVQTFHIVGLTRIFDVTMFGHVVTTLLMLLAIIRFDLFGTREVAKEFVIDRISEGIIAVDNDGVIRYFNAPAKALYPQIENGRDNLPEEIRSSAEGGDNIVINDRIYQSEENELTRGDKSFGKLYALVDETDHIRYMDELREQRELADCANVAKSRFLASMSHEIRTPINAVLGMDEIILRESKEKSIRSYAADIMSAGRTLLSLINDILDLSKVEEGKMEIIPVEYDLASLINDLSNMIKDRAEKKGLKFEIEVEEEIPHLLVGDEIRIRQCVLNLLTNGVKYTEKGSVTMRVAFEKRAESHIGLMFAVSDTGIGMKPEDMERLFTPYQRIEEKRNRAIEGTGLGMSITRQLLELMGSELDVKSDYGKGSVFSFTVGQEVVDWEEIGDCRKRFVNENTGYRELFTAPDARILVVDDTEINIKVMEHLLKKTLIRIDRTLTGGEAVALCEKNEYDVLFIDHMMPGMDGIETLEHIREKGLNTKTPAVALTANAVSGAKQMYLEAGFDDYLSKPVDSTRLEKMLYEMIPDQKLMAPAKESEASDDSGSELTSDESENRYPGLPDWIYGIPEIDIDEGMRNSGMADIYMDVLATFCESVESNADEIEQLLADKNITDYTIKVHALKSSARIIGALGLSEHALRLEEAGKKNETDLIEEETGILLRSYRSLGEDLTRLMSGGAAESDISEKELEDGFGAIAELAQAGAYDMLDSVVEQFRGYHLPAEYDIRLRQIEKLMPDLDYDGIRKEAEAAIALLQK